MVNELEKKYNTKIKTAINNNNPYTQVLDLKPQKTEYKPTVNPYNQQTEQKLKPLPKADFEPLVNQAKYTFEGGVVNSLKSLYRTATNLDDAYTYSQSKPIAEKDFQVGFTDVPKDTKGDYELVASGNKEQYKAVKDSMESQYDYANMPETTKKAYQQVVNTLLTQETYGKSFEEQRQVVRSLYENKEIPDFVQNKLANIDSKETEYNLNVENARQNLVKMAMDNASDVRNLESKYADKDISQATRFTTDILGSIVKMSPYIAVSAITGGVGGATLGSIAGTGTMYVQVYTDSMSKAISEGATREQATEYAHISAMIEAGTEMLSGGIPGAPKGLLSSGIQGKIDDVVKVMVKDGTFRKFISTGVDVFGEGAEEALAEYLGSMALSIYTEDERSDEELTQDMIKAFIMGSVTSATMQMGKYGIIKAAEKFVAEKSTDVQNISLEQANDVMNRIALRTQVENFDGLSYKLEDLPKGNNGYIIDGKTIVLNRNQVEESGLIESALPHEMTHALEKVKGYDQLASFVVNLKAKTLGMDLAQLQQVYQEKFDEVHQQAIEMGDTSHQLEIATPDKMARELVAEFIKDNIASRPYKDAQGNIQYDSDGNIITYRNYDALLRLASNQPNMVNKIKKVIRSMIRKGKIQDAKEFGNLDSKGVNRQYNGLLMEEYLDSLDSYLNTVLDNADKGLFTTEQAQGLQFDTKSLSRNTEQGVKVIQAYESENGEYKGTLEDAQKLLDYSARKGLGFNEVQYEGGTLVRPNNVQLSLDQLKKDEIDVNEVRNITKDLNLSTLIPLIEQSKQSASDYINSLNIQSDNPNVIKYLETMSNFVRDYNADLRYDTIGNLTTQAQEDDFNLRENGKLKVFYLSGEPFNKDAINYGYILTSNPVGLDNPKQVYVSLRKPLYDIAEESMQEFNFVLGKDIQKVIDVFNSKGNNLVLDTDELTNADILKAIGDELGSVDKIKEFYQTLNEVTGYDGIELTSSRQIILFNESQFGEAKVKGEYSEQAKKEVKTINFKKSGTEYLVRMNNFNGVEETRILSKENVIEVLGDDFAKVVLNATNQEQSYDVVENIISKPSNKTKQGVFSQERDDRDNQLTEEVVKFNSESSIRQKDGTLKVMYHGSPNRFEEFSYLNLGTTGAQEGIGIYFTDSPLQASQYTRNEQGMVYEVYLNIKNPTNKTKKTITKEQLKQIVLDIHNSEDNEFLYNYGDISREGLDTVANKAVNLILESNKNNVDIIDTVLIDSRIDTEQGLRIVNQYTGIDGYTLNTSDGMVSIAFFPEQIKSINNPNPTTDRRIQYSIELDSVKQQQIEQAKLNSTNNLSNARSILNDGTLTTSDSVPLESVLLNPLYNQAIINKMPTKDQKEQLQAFYLDTLARSGDTVYLELHDNDRVAYLKYPVVSDLDVVNSDIAKFYNANQQQEFFKDSKVRDEQGNLKVMYHGTPKGDFKEFKPGSYFTSNKEDADKYQNTGASSISTNKVANNPKTYEVYLNITKPFDTRIPKIRKIFEEEYLGKYGMGSPLTERGLPDWLDGMDLQEFIEEKGYDFDGLILDEGGTGGYGEDVVSRGISYVVFNPNQVKETTNLAPTLSPDIRYSIEDERIRTQKFSKSVLESNLSKQTQDTIEKQIAEGTFNSVVVADRPSIERALAEIGEDVDKAYNKFKAKIDSGLRMTKDDLVIGQLLIKKLEKSRQTEKVVSLVQDVALLGTELGQQVQALHLIKRMSAEGKLMMLQKTLTRLQDSVNSSKDRNAPRVQLEIPKEYQEFFVEVGARTQELEEQRVQLDNLNQELESQENQDRIKELESQIAKLEEQIKSNEQFTSKENVDDILDEVKSKIAEQLPVTWKDKLDAWRYMSMLGNLRTNVRNVLGNAFVMPMTFSRDILSVGLQQFLPQEQRTRVLRASKEAENFALNDYLTVGKDIMEGTQKYDMKTDIERKRTIFKNRLLEGFREGTFKALEVGDTVFTKKHYITQMAKYLTAQNIDLNTIADEQLENARKFAIDEAQKNTFKQGSDLANALNRIERKGGVAGTIVKAVIPFKKTPINILKMGLEYSPLGVLNGIKKIAFDVKSGKVTASQAIDTLSAGLTGTGIALLGATLYGMGFIEIGADDDETKRVYNYKNSLGRQRYSIQIGEGSYSIDWIAPAIMPFIMGAEMMRAFESDTEASLLDSLYDATLDIFDPVFELTMLQGVTDTLQSYAGSGAAMFGETLTTMGSNYINQFVPTLLGQIARTIDPIQRSTLPDAKGSLSSTLETTFRKLGNKIPYVSMMNAPVVDVKGQPISSDENPFMRAFMNFVSPGYYKTDNTTEIDQEILRLYELTENTNVLPKATPKSFQFGGKTYKLGNKEYSDFGIVMGEKSYQLLGKLTRYDLDDETKVKVMDNLYDYAYQLAKDKYLRTQGLENDDASYKKVIEAELKGIPTLDYLIAKYAYSTMSGEDKKENFSNFLNENGFDDDLMEIVGGYKPSSSKLKTKGLKKLK